MFLISIFVSNIKFSEMIFLIVLSVAFSLLAGFAIGRVSAGDGTVGDGDGSYWNIVRYKKDGSFDCLWETAIYDKRVADKRCARLNDPNEGNEHLYGVYVVEKF